MKGKKSKPKILKRRKWILTNCAVNIRIRQPESGPEYCEIRLDYEDREMLDGLHQLIGEALQDILYGFNNLDFMVEKVEDGGE